MARSTTLHAPFRLAPLVVPARRVVVRPTSGRRPRVTQPDTRRPLGLNVAIVGRCVLPSTSDAATPGATRAGPIPVACSNLESSAATNEVAPHHADRLGPSAPVGHVSRLQHGIRGDHEGHWRLERAPTAISVPTVMVPAVPRTQRSVVTHPRGPSSVDPTAYVGDVVHLERPAQRSLSGRRDDSARSSTAAMTASLSTPDHPSAPKSRATRSLGTAAPPT